MKMTLMYNGHSYDTDLSAPLDISIPVRFDDVQLSVFGTPPARGAAVQAGSFVGAVAQGGSCNCETYTITPHCNGTHTECVGHITHDRVHVTDCLRDTFLPALLVTVAPSENYEHYIPAPQKGDVMILRADIERAVAPYAGQYAAIIVRTLPNGADKVTRNYHDAMPAYFSHDAMAFVAALPDLRHILVDTPSVDRLADEGRLGNHRIFWGVAEGDVSSAPSPRTITELIYVPDHVTDGLYLLNLQVAPFHADAAPSRPVLYKVENNDA